MFTLQQEECCGNCRFYMAGVKVCRCGPPTPLMIGVKKGISGMLNDEPMIVAYFPPMMPNGWCGAHKPIDPPETEN